MLEERATDTGQHDSAGTYHRAGATSYHRAGATSRTRRDAACSA